MIRKEPPHSEDLLYRASSSSTSPHVGDNGGTKSLKGSDYEVFLSFRGEDTRKGFTDHLYTSLVDAGIRVYRDDNELRVGEEIGPELLRSIRQSKFSIPIISEDYASSKWCLQELAQMLKCRRSGEQVVLPIFYKVEPSQVRHLNGRFGDAINAHKKNLGQMVVKEWEEALNEVSSLKGWESEKIDNGHEATLVKMVVIRVMRELKRLFDLSVPEQLVGTNHPVKQIMSKIDTNFNVTRIIGIYGMGGIGKTTLAKVLYNKLSSHFKDRSFVANIRERSQRNGIECLQKQLISNVIGESWEVSNVDDGIRVLKSRCKSRKVLALLDDMDDNTHLDALVGDGSWFEAGSIVIITTRNKSIIDKVRASPLHELEQLPLNQSLILFSRHAFRNDYPPSDYKHISHDIVSITGGLPLALEVIGSYLCGKTKATWKDTSEKLKKRPDKKVQDTLMVSYEALDIEEKQIFLDIACFFIEESKQYPTYMWDACDFFPRKGIEVLSLMSLIKVDEDGTLMMHDQLRDLGREIVRLENEKKPGERSRLWTTKEAENVLESNKGTCEIEALRLDNCHSRWGTLDKKSYRGEQFNKLINLRFLLVNNINFTGDFQNSLAQLRWLQWRCCPFYFEVVNFHPKKLAVLDLSWSKISEDWEGWGPLKMATELKVLDLSHCNNLRRTPDLSAFESLEILNLEHCRNLEEIHPSICYIKTLVDLNICNCRELTQLPKSIGSMEALETLYAVECFWLHCIPNSIGNLASLSILYMSYCGWLREIPDSIGNLQSLVELNLSCTSIAKLPESIGNLQNLRKLYIMGVLLTELPSAIGMLAKLSLLEASCCEYLEELPSSIGELVSLNELHLECSGIRGLPESISKLSSLRRLDVCGCKNLREIPKPIFSITALERLELFCDDSLRPREVTSSGTTSVATSSEGDLIFDEATNPTIAESSEEGDPLSLSLSWPYKFRRPNPAIAKSSEEGDPLSLSLALSPSL